MWDAQLYRAEDADWSLDHDLRPDAITELDAMLGRRPTTFGWAHNQGCDAIYRFDGPARIAVAGNTAIWTITSTSDPDLRARIADTLGIPLG